MQPVTTASPPLHRDRSFLLLLFIIIGFICWRAQWLAVPFYWDEAWVYAPAVRAMDAAGPSLLPDAIDTSLSRGHPLLFHASAALWTSGFGTSSTSMHAFALLIATALLVTVYLIGRSLCGGWAGLAMMALVLTHEGFLAQSALLLPELMLTLWGILSLYFYLEKKWWAYVISGSCLLLTKESGLALILAITAWHTLLMLTPPWVERKRHVLELFTVLAPLIPLALFFSIQYNMFGWVFFPEHLDLITPGSKDVTYKARLIFIVLFEEQGRIVFTFAFTFVPILLWKIGKPLLRSTSAVLAIAAIKALWGRWPIPFIPEPWSTLVLLCGLFFALYVPFHRSAGARSSLPALAFLVVVAYWSFCALNFYTDRYLLMPVPIIAAGGGWFLWRTMNERPRWLYATLMTCCVLAQAMKIGSDDKIGDTRLSYLDAISAEQGILSYCEQQQMHDATILTDFVNVCYLQDVEAGYLTKGLPFTGVTTDPHQRSEFAIVSNTSPMEIEASDYVPIHRVTHGKAWVELRRHK